jgi:hypothetical protein
LISDDPDAIAVSMADECKTCGEEEEELKTAKSNDIRQAETEQVRNLDTGMIRVLWLTGGVRYRRF